MFSTCPYFASPTHITPGSLMLAICNFGGQIQMYKFSLATLACYMHTGTNTVYPGKNGMLK